MGCIPTVSKFLCCLSLEIGGYICSIITAIAAGMSFIATLILIFSSLTAEYSGGWWFTVIISLIYYALLLYASCMLFLGTKNSNPNQMRLYLIFMVCGVIIAFMQFVLVQWAGLIGAIIWTIIVVYFFICIYSLFKHSGGTSIFC